MATNAIQGDLVGVFYSTNLVTPAWKEIVCAENTGTDGSRDVNTRRTKCGVVKGYGPAAWTITGSGTHNHTPGGSQGSADELATIFQDETPILVKVVHAVDDDLLYRSGQGQVTRFTESLNSGDPASFDFTIDIEGDLVLVAP